MPGAESSMEVLESVLEATGKSVFLEKNKIHNMKPTTIVELIVVLSCPTPPKSNGNTLCMYIMCNHSTGCVCLGFLHNFAQMLILQISKGRGRVFTQKMGFNTIKTFFVSNFDQM